MGAIFALAKLGTGSPPILEKIVLSLIVFPVVVVVVGLLLLHLQLLVYNFTFSFSCTTCASA
jgi:hypothetical protein